MTDAAGLETSRVLHSVLGGWQNEVSRALFKLLASDTLDAQPAGRLLLEWEKEVAKGLEVPEHPRRPLVGAPTLCPVRDNFAALPHVLESLDVAKASQAFSVFGPRLQTKTSPPDGVSVALSVSGPEIFKFPGITDRPVELMLQALVENRLGFDEGVAAVSTYILEIAFQLLDDPGVHFVEGFEIEMGEDGVWTSDDQFWGIEALREPKKRRSFIGDLKAAFVDRREARLLFSAYWKADPDAVAAPIAVAVQLHFGLLGQGAGDPVQTFGAPRLAALMQSVRKPGETVQRAELSRRRCGSCRNAWCYACMLCSY